MKTLTAKVLAVLAIVMIALGTTAVLAIYYTIMWDIICNVTTTALVLYGIYRFIKWLFEEELEEKYR